MHLQYPYLAIPTCNIYHIRNENGNYSLPINEHPEMLIGTFNKILEYTRPVYLDLYHFFYSSMKITDYLVITGTSFNDKGINSIIIDWLSVSEVLNKDIKIVIIHPCPNNLRRSTRPAIRRSVFENSQKKYFSIIPKSIENTEWNEIRKYL